MHPTDATLAGRYALQLSYQANGEKKTGWLGKKPFNGKNAAFFVPDNELNELSVFENIQYDNQDYYRLPDAPETKHCEQDLYLSIVANGDKIMVGFSGCWGAAGWNFQHFTPRWFAGKKKADYDQDYTAYQGEQRDKERKTGDNLVWTFTGKRLALDNGDTGNPLVCLCDPPILMFPNPPNPKQIPDPYPGDRPERRERDKLNDSVLTVERVSEQDLPQSVRGG